MLTPISQTLQGTAALQDRFDPATLRVANAAPAVARPETERAVTAAGAAQRVVPTASRAAAPDQPALPLPDPDAPTGPPPAFDRSPLEKERNERFADRIYAYPSAPALAPETTEAGLATPAPAIDLRR